MLHDLPTRNVATVLGGALDTFNGDSIPVHLLTEQAIEIYLRHLAPDGILAAHISSNFLDLRPVLYKQADDFGLGTALIESQGDAGAGTLSTWMLFTRNRAFLSQTAIVDHATPRPAGEGARLRAWTDDYSNLFQILR